MRIDIVFDFVCPWSYVGVHRLLQTLAQKPAVRADLHWVPYMLNPMSGISTPDLVDYLRRRAEIAGRIQHAQDGACRAAHEMGLEMHADSPHTLPDTTRAHMLLLLAQTRGRAMETVERLFHAWFVEGRDLTSEAELIDLASELGFSPSDVIHQWADGYELETMQTRQMHMQRNGITGVPCFIFNGIHAISGAQSAEILSRMVDLAASVDFHSQLSETV